MNISNYVAAQYPLPLRIVRSTRRKKSIGIQVLDDEIVIRVPHTATAQQIQQALDRHDAWIQSTVQKRAATTPVEDWKLHLLYQGSPLVLTYQAMANSCVVKRDGKLIVSGPDSSDSALKAAVIAWYRQEAHSLIHQRLQYWGRQMEAEFNQVRIKTLKSRWGSCSSQRNLNFNWRLVCAPVSVLDYVIVHELCHLREMNHSARFWSHVESILPDYKKRRDWLRQNGHSLYF